MKPQSIEDSHKQRGWVAFSTFAFVDSIPAAISYRENLMAYRGADSDLTIPWGVYGTTSFNAASFFASHYAAKKKKSMMVLTVWYYIEGFTEATSTLPQSIEACGGFLHLARVGAKLRDALREEFMVRLHKEREASQLSKYDELSWGMLLMREPVLIRKFLKGRKDLNVIVHPVQQTFDPKAEEAIQVGSFKLKRDLIMAVEARYLPDVAVQL